MVLFPPFLNAQWRFVMRNKIDIRNVRKALIGKYMQQTILRKQKLKIQIQKYLGNNVIFSVSVQFSHSVVSDSLDPMDCRTPGFPVHYQLPEFTQTHVHSWWCSPTISSSAVPFSSHLQSFPASGSFPMSQFFATGGQSIGVSVSASELSMNIQDWFPLGWTGWFPCSPKDSRESSQTPQFKSINSLVLSFL